jgi:hypothetical protein
VTILSCCSLFSSIRRFIASTIVSMSSRRFMIGVVADVPVRSGDSKI